jgi:hypothetical protein
MRPVKISLVILQLILFVNACGGAVYGLAGAKAIPRSWLEGSPFQSYVIPSLFLLIAVGGSMLVATVLWLLGCRVADGRWAPWASIAAGSILVGWIVAQVAMIGYVSWMQPACFVAGLAIAALGAVALRLRARAGVGPVTTADPRSQAAC